jgi:(4-O-methyl)-D-glucuronate---lignin esterase
MNARIGRLVTLVVLVLGVLANPGLPIIQSADDPLETGFAKPPSAARPRVWWHWMNGNITKEGIKLDLEWMNRVGIGGFQNFDASLFADQVVEKRLVYMTPEWKDAFSYTTTLADQLGLEMAIAGSPGWSESGGPWVTPAQAMKKLVWSETRVEGGKRFTGTLPKPPSTTGPFQNAPLMSLLARLAGQTPKAPPELYNDSGVVAYRVPASDVPMGELHPVVTWSSGTIDPSLLADSDFVKFAALPMAPVGEKAWIQFDFGKPVAIRAASLSIAGFKWPFGPPPPGPDLESSDDGQSFRKVVNIPRNTAAQNTVSFPSVLARFFRVAFVTPPPPPPREIDIPLPPPPTEHQIAELVLHTGARVTRFEEKAAFVPLAGLSDLGTPAVAPADAVRKSEVLDLTSKMGSDGSLDWTPPAGQWVVLRMGYSLLGVTNHPASPEGTGFEVDKLNPDHVKAYMDAYLDSYKSAVGPLMGSRGLGFLISDSYEAGASNWTDRMIEEFTRRRGYDPRPWLPVLTGRVVESAEASDRFLWDFRRALSDMLAEYHYDLITTLLKARGMGHYGESHEGGRAFIGDGMEAKRTNDVPMSAMWTQRPGVNAEQHGYNADIRESASVAHLYGKTFVAAESLTAGSVAWGWCPATLKPTADKELAMGLNRFVIHTSVHQPLLDKGPGLSLGPFGQWFTRNETWAEQASAWVTYLARSSFLLQQGRFVADVAYYYGEDTNVTALFRAQAPPVPAGYNFDYVNADALVHLLSVVDGQLAAPSGMRYRVLALDPNSRHMSLPVLRKIRDLVSAGAVVAGPKPLSTPSLSDDEAEFRRLADELWGSGGAGSKTGKGVVKGDGSLGDVLKELGVAPDFEHTKPKADTALLAVHRALADGDLYFVNNRNDREEDVEASFRVTGKQAELWHADTGLREAASFRIANGRTTVPLHLEPWGAVFVVFRKPAADPVRQLPASTEKPLATVDGAWDVRFQPGRGAPERVTLDSLASWSTHADAGVKYFSGTATYTKTVQAQAGWFAPGARLWLDLGDVRDLAEVSVNGTALGVVWKRPFRAEITTVAKPGANTIEVKVTNLWVNRMIGDRQPGASTQYTFTRPVFYKADSPLVPSGLLGPVRLLQVTAGAAPAASAGRQ